MYKPFIYPVVTYFLLISLHMRPMSYKIDYLHPQLNKKKNPMDGVLVGVGSL